MIYLPLPEGTYRISQWFGDRPKYYKKYGHKGHNGYDFAPLDGTSPRVIYAPHEGYVQTFKTDAGYGYYIRITSLPYTKDGMVKISELAHLKEFLVTDGQYVGSGDPIAIMGGAKGQIGSGDSTGTHLHWTYKKGNSQGKTVDKDNGYNGAIAIAPFTLKWINQKLYEPS